MKARQLTPRQRALVLGALGALLVYLLIRRRILTEDGILLLLVLFPSVILHEVSHGALALAFGDDTAKRAGRLTLNPAPHVDPLGTVILPALLLLAGAPAFGWAKPVPVQPARMRDPRNHALLVSLVGPAVNVAVALAVALVLRFSCIYESSSLAVKALFALGLVNVVLATFNLLPIPPLDGSAVVERLLPDRWWPAYVRIRPYSLLVLLAVVLIVPNVLSWVFEPAIGLWERLI
ncbi:MAG: site-2 protease family protein [Actinomycetota bacterium]|nr:site-2 protease family protein [Actinomycetota bacterium]